jgi:hypothetical protein
MSLSPEVSDVDISKLFEWRTDITILNSSGEELNAYMRLVGDAELNRARIKGLRASADLRKKLNNVNSDERIALVPSLDSIDKENIIELLIILNMSKYREPIEKEIRIPFPKEISSDASLEEREKYQKEIDDYPDKRMDMIKKALDKRVNSERKLYNKKSIEELLSEYEKLLISQMCEAEMNNTFIGYSIYFGTFKDEGFKYKLFESFDEYNNVPTYVKDQLFESYIKLQLGISELKK